MAEALVNPNILDNAFVNTTYSTRCEINNMARSGNYYCTPEMEGKMRNLRDGIEHVKLDHELVKSSPDFGPQWDRARTAGDLNNAGRVISHIGNTMKNLKCQMEKRSISQQQDCDVRQQHHAAMNALKAGETALAPYAGQSIDRLRQYCDFVGVTDRFTGYRNNLNRPYQDPVRVTNHWWHPERIAGWSTKGCLPLAPPKRKGDPALIAHEKPPVYQPDRPVTTTSDPEKQLRYDTMATLPERCGINTTFPGRTEYMVRYNTPHKEHNPVPFTVNPTPITDVHGRHQMAMGYEPRITEYQKAFEWPNGNKIDKLPWIKNF